MCNKLLILFEVDFVFDKELKAEGSSARQLGPTSRKAGDNILMFC